MLLKRIIAVITVILVIVAIVLIKRKVNNQASQDKVKMDIKKSH